MRHLGATRVFLNGTRNIVILTGFLATTETPTVRRLFQNVAAATYTTVIVSADCALPDMAAVDVSGPIVTHEGAVAMRADFICPASEQSFMGVKNFLKTGHAGEKIEVLDFNPLHEWQLKPELATQLRSGESNWGLSDLDEMAGWVAEGIAVPPKQRFMNRLIITGLPVKFGRRVVLNDRIYNPCDLLLGPGETPVEVRLYNDMRLWSSVTRIVAGATSPITITGTLRAKFDPETGGRKVFVDAVDVYAATTEDLPNGVPSWMSEKIQETLDRRKVDLEVRAPQAQ